MATKPDKPNPEFPFYAHASGKWAKKIQGVVHYFGSWANPQAAYDEYQRFLGNGSSQDTADFEGLTVRQLVNSFLNSKNRLLECAELRQRAFEDYYIDCKRILKVFGRNRIVESLRPIDFEKPRADFAKTHGPKTLCGDITRTRVLFNDADKTFEVRVRYGDTIPSRFFCKSA